MNSMPYYTPLADSMQRKHTTLRGLARGFFVAPLSGAEARDLYELLAVLEADALELAASHFPGSGRYVVTSTAGEYPEAVAAGYVARWRLPRPDFHRLVITTFHGAPTPSC